jgi:hypothetical protein
MPGQGQEKSGIRTLLDVISFTAWGFCADSRHLFLEQKTL